MFNTTYSSNVSTAFSGLCNNNHICVLFQNPKNSKHSEYINFWPILLKNTHLWTKRLRHQFQRIYFISWNLITIFSPFFCKLDYNWDLDLFMLHIPYFYEYLKCSGYFHQINKIMWIIKKECFHIEKRKNAKLISTKWFTNITKLV